MLAAVAAAGALAVPDRAEAEPARWAVSVDAGPEYDTNIHRCERDRDDCPIAAAPLARTTARLRTSWRLASNHRVGLGGFGGSKRYASRVGRDEDVLVAAGDGQYQWRLPDRHAIVSARGSYYERFAVGGATAPDQVEQRNFSLLGGELGLDVVGEAGHAVTLVGGLRRFRYKPDPAFDWDGDHYGLRYRHGFWRGDDEDGAVATIDVALSYGLERRGYRGPALRRSEACPDEVDADVCLIESSTRRDDLYHKVEAELAYTGDRLYGVRYEFEAIDSNSAGPYTQMRHRVELGLTSELFARIFLTAELGLQLIRYRESLLLAETPDMGGSVDPADLTAIDDESRSALTMHLSRDLGSSWSIEGRYGFYTNALDFQGVDFRRHLVYLGVVYRGGSE